MQKSQNSCTIVTVKANFLLRTISNKAHPLKILRLKNLLKITLQEVFPVTPRGIEPLIPA